MPKNSVIHGLRLLPSPDMTSLSGIEPLVGLPAAAWTGVSVQQAGKQAPNRLGALVMCGPLRLRLPVNVACSLKPFQFILAPSRLPSSTSTVSDIRSLPTMAPMVFSQGPTNLHHFFPSLCASLPPTGLARNLYREVLSCGASPCCHKTIWQCWGLEYN